MNFRNTGLIRIILLAVVVFMWWYGYYWHFKSNIQLSVTQPGFLKYTEDAISQVVPIAEGNKIFFFNDNKRFVYIIDDYETDNNYSSERLILWHGYKYRILRRGDILDILEAKHTIYYTQLNCYQLNLVTEELKHLAGPFATIDNQDKPLSVVFNDAIYFHHFDADQQVFLSEFKNGQIINKRINDLSRQESPDYAFFSEHLPWIKVQDGDNYTYYSINGMFSTIPAEWRIAIERANASIRAWFFSNNYLTYDGRYLKQFDYNDNTTIINLDELPDLTEPNFEIQSTDPISTNYTRNEANLRNTLHSELKIQYMSQLEEELGANIYTFENIFRFLLTPTSLLLIISFIGIWWLTKPLKQGRIL